MSNLMRACVYSELVLILVFFQAHLFWWVRDLRKLMETSLLDMEIGLAFPTIATAKIGGGFYLNKEQKVMRLCWYSALATAPVYSDKLT